MKNIKIFDVLKVIGYVLLGLYGVVGIISLVIKPTYENILNSLIGVFCSINAILMINSFVKRKKSIGNLIKTYKLKIFYIVTVGILISLNFIKVFNWPTPLTFFALGCWIFVFCINLFSLKKGYL